MAQLNNIDHLLATRDFLNNSLEKSREVAYAIDKTGPRLEEIKQQIPSLETAIKTIARKCAIYAVRGHVDQVAGPVGAVLKVFNVVNELESLVSVKANTRSDLNGYLSNLKRLEEGLKFLTNNCTLVILWMEDLLRYLEENTSADDCYLVSNVKKSLRILHDLHATEENSRLNGGILYVAYNKLENEFRDLLIESNFPISEDVIHKLQAIIGRLSANNCLEKCVSIYIEARISNARRTLQDLNLDYLKTSVLEFDSIEDNHLDQWGRQLEFFVKNVLEPEYKLCNDVFLNVGPDVAINCFAKISVRSGMGDFIKFGNTVTKCKKAAMKLFKLLDIFAALNKLRFDFNRLFRDKACLEIQTQTRDLIQKVVNGVCDIFWELSVQVELQSQTSPALNGSVPMLVSFVTDYSNQLLDDYYKPVLAEVLEIHWSWNHERFEKVVLLNEIEIIVKALEINLQIWGKTYEDTTLSHFFMMNNHWYLMNLKGTKLGDLLGDSWLKGHEERVEYYASVYIRESWGTLTHILSEEGLVLFSGGRFIDRDLVKKRIWEYGEAFDDLYYKQSKWVVCDKGLKWKICRLVTQVIVPVYRNYMQKYMHLVEQESTNKYVKYSAEGLENMVSSLFEPKLGKYSSRAKCTHMMSEINNVVTTQFSSSPAAA